MLDKLRSYFAGPRRATRTSFSGVAAFSKAAEGVSLPGDSQRSRGPMKPSSIIAHVEGSGMAEGIEPGALPKPGLTVTNRRSRPPRWDRWRSRGRCKQTPRL